MDGKAENKSSQLADNYFRKAHGELKSQYQVQVV
jgi:hypothetical protein